MTELPEKKETCCHKPPQHIPYAVSYAVADITIAILVDKGIKKLRGMDKADDLSKVGTKMDDAANMADEIGDVAGAGG